MVELSPLEAQELLEVHDEAHHAAVLAEGHGLVAEDLAQGHERLQDLLVGDDLGRGECVGVGPGPQHAASGLALGELGRDADELLESAPALQDPRRTVRPDDGEAGVVGVAGGRVELAMVGPEARAVAEEGEANRVGLLGLRRCLLLVELLEQEPEEGVGEALGDVAAGRHAEPEDELHDPRRRGGQAVFVLEPVKAGLEPLRRVRCELVEVALEVVGEEEEVLPAQVRRVTECGDVVSELGVGGLVLRHPPRLACGDVDRDGLGRGLLAAVAEIGRTARGVVGLAHGALRDGVARDEGDGLEDLLVAPFGCCFVDGRRHLGEGPREALEVRPKYHHEADGVGLGRRSPRNKRAQLLVGVVGQERVQEVSVPG